MKFQGREKGKILGLDLNEGIAVLCIKNLNKKAIREEKLFDLKLTVLILFKIITDTFIYLYTLHNTFTSRLLAVFNNYTSMHHSIYLIIGKSLINLNRL